MSEVIWNPSWWKWESENLREFIAEQVFVRVLGEHKLTEYVENFLDKSNEE